MLSSYLFDLKIYIMSYCNPVISSRHRVIIDYLVIDAAQIPCLKADMQPAAIILSEYEGPVERDAVIEESLHQI